MTELTPERLREAAAVTRACANPPNIWTSAEAVSMLQTAAILDNHAIRIERELAQVAERRARIEELAREMYSYFHPGCQWVESPQYLRAATNMLTAYPALAEPPAGQPACDCGNENDASWCDDECASRSEGR